MELSAPEERVLAHLDEAALVARLAALVRIPSVSGTPGEVDVVDAYAAMLDDAGLDLDHWAIDLQALAADPEYPGAEVERERAFGLVGTSGAEDGARPALVLQGHLDVVPPGDPAAWGDLDPFGATVRDGRLFGRGACDMKAGVAANLAVVETLRAAGVRLARPLALHAVVGEEDGGLGALATIRRGHRGDAAVLTEPTGGRLVVANAGALTFRIEVPGRSAHGSLRHEGHSALEAFWPVHRALLALEAERNRDVDPLFGERAWPYALSIGIVAAGDWASSVPDRLVAEGRYGIRLGEPPHVAQAAFEHGVAAAAAADPWLRDHPPLVSWPGGQFASGRTDPAEPIVAEVSAAATSVGLPPPPACAEVYGSDLRIYAGIGAIPTVQFGPGDPTWAHAAGEHVEIADLVAVTRALVVLALRRCGVR